MICTTFDLFDTLISRVYFKPEDLLKQLGHEVLDKYGLKNFYEIRIQAENDLRNRSKHEICLSQIYEAIIDKTGLPIATIKEIKNKELDLELSSYNPIHLNLEKIKKEKFKVIITDTYFSKNFIEKIIKKILNIEVDFLFVSSELGYKKSNGTMYFFVKEKLNLNFNNWIHIGDNYQSDFKIPKDIGINSVLFNDLNSSLWKNFIQTDNLNCSRFFGELSNFINSKTLSHHELYFGRSYIPLLYSLVHDIKKFKDKNMFNQILFLSRDGYLFYSLYKKLYPDDKVKYIYASRKLLLPMASLSKSNFDIEYYLSHFKIQSIESFFSGLNFKLLEKHILKLSRLNFTPKKKLNENEKRKFKFFINNDTEFKIEISNHLLKIKENYIEYLANKKIFNDEKILIFDLGWHGNMQIHLQRILNEKKINVFGYYFDLLTNNHNSKTYLDHRNTLNHIYSIDMMEYFFTSYHGSLDHIFKKNKSIEFSFKKISKENKILFSKIEELTSLFFNTLIKKNLNHIILSKKIIVRNLIFNNVFPSPKFITELENKKLEDDLNDNSFDLIQKVKAKNILKILINGNFSGLIWPYGSISFSYKRIYYFMVRLFFKIKRW